MLLVAALVVAASACSGQAADPPAGSSAAASSSSSGSAGSESTDLDTMVDIGGRSLHLVCRGEGSPHAPTVLIETGLNGTAADWSGVQGSMADFARVCAYDRAGNGLSDAAPQARRTAADLAEDLAALVAEAPLDPPLVVVSHSMGPWPVTLFVAAHPGLVVGQVMVDPRGPEVSDRQAAALGPERRREPVAVTEAREFFASGGFDDNEEGVVFAPSEHQVSAVLGAPGPAYGDMPVVVLSAADVELPDLPTRVYRRWLAIWHAGQRRYAAESADGAVVRVPDSGHIMQEDQPQAVVDAVRRVVDAAG